MSHDACSSDDTSAIIRNFGLCEGDDSTSSELDWTVFDEELTVETAANEAVRSSVVTVAGPSRIARAPRCREHGYGVRRSRIASWQGFRASGAEGSSRSAPAGYDPSLGFSYDE